MYGKDPQSLEPYLLYSSTLAHNPQGTAPAKSLPIQKPRPYARHLHRGFVDKQNVWHPAEHNHGSPLGCVLEEDEELDEADDAKSVRNPGLRDSGYSSGSASSEDGEPDTPREGFFPASKQQMIDTQRSVKDFRQQHSLPVPIQHDNPSNSRRTKSWPSFRRTPNHIMPPKPLVAEEPYLIYSTPSPTNCLTPPIEKALIYSTFSPPQGVKSRHTLSPVSIGRTTISSLESSPLRSASNFYPSQPQEPIKPKYTSPFDPFAGDPSAFTPSPDDMVLTRNSRSRFA